MISLYSVPIRKKLPLCSLHCNKRWHILALPRKLPNVNYFTYTQIRNYHDLFLLHYLLLFLWIVICLSKVLLNYGFLGYNFWLLVRFLGFAPMFLNRYGPLGLNYAIWVCVVIHKLLLKACQCTNSRLYCLVYQFGVLLLHVI